ncbi:hypothetical protein J7E34_18990 [Chryseobacterium sp. ISL-80]|nr:hypothetical protein [Chryseobacterium sp. ISL-80]
MNFFNGGFRDSSGGRNRGSEEFENDKNNTNLSKNRTSRNPKGSGKPLILAPPTIKSVEEKTSQKSTLQMDEIEDESSDNMGISVVAESDDIDQEDFKESPDEVFNEILEESSEFNHDQESYNQPRMDEESQEDAYFEHDFQDSEESDEESSSQPIKLATAAYRGINKTYERTKVRLPLQLAAVNLEIDIFDTFKLSRPISSISNVECSLHSLDAEVLLPSANLFTKGILLLTMDYVNTDDLGTMHSLKIHLPWKKIIPVHWIHQPELSSKHSKEYMFTSPLGTEAGFTREYKESLVEKVDFSLANLHCVWNEQFVDQDKIMFQGTAGMKIDLFQKQCVDLQKLISR